jgi:hypothetical protein
MIYVPSPVATCFFSAIAVHGNTSLLVLFFFDFFSFLLLVVNKTDVISPIQISNHA